MENPATPAPLRGEVRRLPPRTAVRLLQALTLITFFTAAASALARYLLAYRHHFALELRGGELILERERVLLGQVFQRARTVLPVVRLQEITLEKAGEPPGFTAGLAALAVGTFLGLRLISEGLAAPGGAPWLLGGGALLILIGVLLDFFVGSGRSHPHFSGSPELLVRVTEERGWVLSRLDLEKAEDLLRAIEEAILKGASPPHSTAPNPPDSPPPLEMSQETAAPELESAAPRG